LLLAGRHLQAGPVLEFIAQERPTVASAVPAILNDLLLEAEPTGTDLSSRAAASGSVGGAARELVVPR
jgi:hypothetical protein